MDIHAYQKYLDDPANFAQGGVLHCLDISSMTHDSTEAEIREQIVPDDEIHQWIKDPPCTFGTTTREMEPYAAKCSEPALRIIAVEDPNQVTRFAWTEPVFPLNKVVYENIVKHFEISPLLLIAALNQDAVYFKHYDIPQHPREVELRLQYVFRTCSSVKGRFALGLTYRPNVILATVLVVGLHGDEIEELFALLRSLRTNFVAPMLLPSVLAGFTWKYIKERLHLCHQITNTVREKMGLPSNLRDPGFCEPPTDDNVELSKSLTRIFEKLAKYDQHCASLLNLFHVLDEAGQSCLEATPDSRKVKVAKATALARTMNSHTASSTQSLRTWTEYLHRKAQAYVQTVYSLIAQRDNGLSIQMAEASLRIAEATRSDNLAMKAIAEDSKAVALESLRKSVTMRTIAVVTMLFLPATFIATLFSTSFFNFQAKDGQVVSRWIWLYVLVTVIMTVVIQGTWFLNTRKKDREIDKALSGVDVGLSLKKHDLPRI